MNRKTLVLLLVDDDVSVRSAIAAQIRTRGVVVVEASGASEVMSIVASLLVDVILTDIEMPRLNGIEMFKQLRARGNALPIIGMSGDPRWRDECLTNGFFSFLDKPFESASLMDVVGELMT